MVKARISELSRALIEIVWYFGPQGLGGECCEDLSMPEFIALTTIAETKNCPVQDVGRSLGFTKSGATRIVNRLAKKNYVNKQKISEDARVCCVVITSKGLDMLASANARYLEKFNELVAKMHHQRSTDVTKVIADMAKALRS